MKVMVIGGGGREHAIIKALACSPKTEKIFALPGNGGIAANATCVPLQISKTDDIEPIVQWALDNAIDFAVVAPDDPLVLGTVDKLEAAGVKCFGPDAKAAAIEGSKSFAKDLMRDYKIPTAQYRVFDDMQAALDFVNSPAVRGDFPVDGGLVVKADGLAKGKGVVVADTLEQAADAIRAAMGDLKFGSAGARVVLEERLSGPEVSVLAFTDSHTVVPMVSSMDHKRAFDFDEGPNTGGMGTVAPNPCYTPEIAQECMKRIFQPTLKAMNDLGRPFKGCLYFGLMITKDGPKVIEYNCRFGDPETQVVLPLLAPECDLLEIMMAVRDERLSELAAAGGVRFLTNKSACCVIVASKEYPGSCKTGYEMDLGNADEMPGVQVYHSGTKLENGKLVNAGGRVIGVTAVADSLHEARELANKAAVQIKFTGARFRSDIGARAEAMSIHRVYVERRAGFDQEAAALCTELRDNCGVSGLERVRIFNRYDFTVGTGTPGASKGSQIAKIESAVFADLRTDVLLKELPKDAGASPLAVEYLPGQYDQRADAAQQCIALLTGEPSTVRTARVYLFYGAGDTDMAAIRQHLINPVESREASLSQYESLVTSYPEPKDVAVLDGFRKLAGDHDQKQAFIDQYGLSMSVDDLQCCIEHFVTEGRDPTMTELRVLDTYWSDHCRHSTFLTALDSVKFDEQDGKIKAAWERYLALRRELGRENKPVTLMDIATIGARALKKRGILTDLVESEEVNACTVHIPVKIKITGETSDSDTKTDRWLLLFKNETHNHPTEIEPFGGAATCVGGAIRDPLSGRGYVYQSMRVTGAADPVTQTRHDLLPGKLPQRTIVTKAAAGYSSYGNQIGIPAGLVDEIYHPGYVAKRMEIGAVIAAVPESDVKQERPEPGDIIFLMGGRTGRDGIGGATGSSKTHTAQSLETCSAEVQKGNAPEERKLQRLFRRPEFTRIIKRCNDFGAGGVSVAVGELADGLDIDLDKVPLKYAGLDGTEIAISESQERMAVVVAKDDAKKLLELASQEDVMATAIATVTAEPRLVMHWRGQRVLDLPRSFIDSNGATRHAKAIVNKPTRIETDREAQGQKSFIDLMKATVQDINVCDKRGLCERFDSTVGANSVLMPFGGKHQRTPTQAMAAKIPVAGQAVARSYAGGAAGDLPDTDTDTSSFLSWGYDPFLSSASPYDGAYMAVTESLARLAVTGADMNTCHLTFQEYFGRLNLGTGPEFETVNARRWGQPLAALLGALDAQMDFGVAAIGGKDSMSGTFTYKADGQRGLVDVPPTLVSFAQALGDARKVISPEFKNVTDTRVLLFRPECQESGLPKPETVKNLFAMIAKLNANNGILAAYTPGFGGVAAAVFKMCLGNGLGFEFSNLTPDVIFGNSNRQTCEFILQLAPNAIPEVPVGVTCVDLGRVTSEPVLSLNHETVKISELDALYSNVLENVFPMSPVTQGLTELPDGNANANTGSIASLVPDAVKLIRVAQPRFVIPVFPGTNCEYESARAVDRAGGQGQIFVVRTLTPDVMRASAEQFAASLDASQGLFLPGGFSNGDEPDGSGKFIAIFLSSPIVRASVKRLLYRGGLICGICNGFQALLKTGLLPYGRFAEPNELGPDAATLTFNVIGRHQSKLIRSRVQTNRSPWLARVRVGDVHWMPISHGEGRFSCGPDVLEKLAAGDQIASLYVDLDDKPTMDTQFNPNGSLAAIEGLISPDGRIFGRMGHAERVGENLYRNVSAAGGTLMFESAIDFLKA